MSQGPHLGFINKKLSNSLKDTGLNNFDLATTRIYKGVRPMWEQLGFESDDSDIPITVSYWNNIIPSEFDFLNKSGIEIQDGDEPIKGSKTPRNLNVVDDNLILDVDFGVNTTDNLIDKTDFSKLHYNQDFELSLDDNLRLKTDTFIIPDSIEKDNSEQAF